MSIVVYWMDPCLVAAQHLAIEGNDLGKALKLCETLRKTGMNHVSLCSEHSDSVGQSGVDAVIDGKTPDGFSYEWSKKHRGDGPKP